MTAIHRTSYCKTLSLAAAASGVAAVMGWVIRQLSWGMLSTLLTTLCWVIAAALCLVALSGVVVLLRDMHQQRARANLFQSLNHARSEATVARGGLGMGLWARRILRSLTFSPAFVVGEMVEVKSYDEISKTLDISGCVDALPFMAEMKQFCGRRARIFRRVDKVYDYGRSKKLRRLDNAYLLSYMRCDGSAHGGCQAGCYVLWKREWLKPVKHGATNESELIANKEVRTSQEPVTAAADAKYVCQFTQLAAATTPLSDWDPRPDFRPLLSGNVTVAAFLLALFTRLFNYAQHLRGGIGYPVLPGKSASVPQAQPLQPGDAVRVLQAEQIAATLDGKGRNRGLWFDSDMLKYCGQNCVVRKRVDRLIDDATGLMRIMKSPCIVLQDVDYSGETLRFAAQEEHLYWREVWLEPIGVSQSDSKVVVERPLNLATTNGHSS